VSHHWHIRSISVKGWLQTLNKYCIPSKKVSGSPSWRPSGTDMCAVKEKSKNNTIMRISMFDSELIPNKTRRKVQGCTICYVGT